MDTGIFDDIKDDIASGRCANGSAIILRDSHLLEINTEQFTDETISVAFTLK